MKCKSGQHVWIDLADRGRCCNGFRRVSDDEYDALQQLGAENIQWRGRRWFGWLPTNEREPVEGATK